MQRSKQQPKSLWQRMWEPKDVQSIAPAKKVLTYIVLIAWTFVVLFPLYWLFITSFKLPIHVFSNINGKLKYWHIGGREQ